MINIIMMMIGLIMLYYFVKPKIPEKEIVLNDNFLNNPETNYCHFNYDDINKEYEKNPKIITDNKKINSINYNTIKSWQPNVYYDNNTKTLSQFNDSNNVLDNNVITYSKDNNEDTLNKTIKEVYDSKIIDFKKDIPKKTINNNNVIECASHLNVISPNDWTYDNEKPENGGEIKDGLFAFDPLIYQTVAMC
jgi:hypothetical protein